MGSKNLGGMQKEGLSRRDRKQLPTYLHENKHLEFDRRLETLLNSLAGFSPLTSLTQEDYFPITLQWCFQLKTAL